MIGLEGRQTGFIALKCMEKLQLFKEEQILFAEKTGKTTVTVSLLDGKLVHTSTTLRDILQQCSPWITKVNRSQIVNFRWVLSMRCDLYIYGNYTIQLYNCKQPIHASRMYAKQCFQMLTGKQLRQ
ncbi:hypothetical protein DUZ99_06790 [Xylanibacillus composti]|uniref:HTH LytTR-type domain-containing protein n=1 Tax=Xylanibacillus composti TaxID=1572762 RepID=A0A8J4M3M1_9BACL|nr:LytTR family transcriptional regulator DNA-binding domain-containing protein [Xylanibacillus composti]MDT9724699.1 hypothetical protein [Xylanibacillus composti]GIQ70984.1 hypothetical protein XYCOK13_38080 [Xylanibacillus composti]